MRLRTERLALWPVGVEDAEGVWRYASDPEVARWTRWKVHASLDESRAYAAAAARSGAWPGVLGIHVREPHNLMAGVVAGRLAGDGATVELGWALARPWWGRGLALEAVSAVARALAADGRCRSLLAAVRPDNGRSAALARRLGMRPAETQDRAGARCIAWRMDMGAWRVALEDRPPTGEEQC